jgi:hypothetical protein
MLSKMTGISEKGCEAETNDDPDTELNGGKAPMTDKDVQTMGKDMLAKMLEKDRERKDQERSVGQRKKGFGRWFKDS